LGGKVVFESDPNKRKEKKVVQVLQPTDEGVEGMGGGIALKKRKKRKAFPLDTRVAGRNSRPLFRRERKEGGAYGPTS